MPRVKPIEDDKATNSEALAGHLSRRVLKRHSGIRARARLAAIQALEQPPIEAIFGEPGQKNGHTEAGARVRTEAKPLRAVGGPARIRT
jgi:hypothetical protein